MSCDSMLIQRFGPQLYHVALFMLLARLVQASKRNLDTKSDSYHTCASNNLTRFLLPSQLIGVMALAYIHHISANDDTLYEYSYDFSYEYEREDEAEFDRRESYYPTRQEMISIPSETSTGGGMTS